MIKISNFKGTYDDNQKGQNKKNTRRNIIEETENNLRKYELSLEKLENKC